MSDKEKAAREWAEGEGDLWTADMTTYGEGHKDAISKAFLAGAEWAEKQSRWIKCSERLPEAGDRIVAIFGPEGGRWAYVSGIVETTTVREQFIEWIIQTYERIERFDDIIYWMPLPEVPKEEE